MAGFDSGATALAVAIGGALWLHQVVIVPTPSVGMYLDRAVFHFAAAFVIIEIIEVGRAVARPLLSWRVTHGDASACGTGGAAAAVERLAGGGMRAQPKALAQRPTPGLRRAQRMAGAALLAILVTAQTASHLDERNAYLYMTTPRFPVGPGSGADGYVFWLEGHPTYMESWQFARQAALYGGASTDLGTGDTDARAGYAYVWTLLARPLGYFGGAVVLNALCWMGAALATWYLARRLLERELPAFGAALGVACGQGFVVMAGTPMSYVAGFAWAPILLALTHRLGLLAPAGHQPAGHQPAGQQGASWRARARWAAWGWTCGVAGLFYFTHVVALATLWLLGLRQPHCRPPLTGLLLASALALAVPASWEVAGRAGVGLAFASTTASDLSSNVKGLLQTAMARPLRLPDEAGQGSVRALAGGFPFPTLPLAVVGIVVAGHERRRWYLAVLLCGLAPAMVLHHLPVTQRYGYLAFPAVYIAAVEGVTWIARLSPRAGWTVAGVILLAGIQLLQANADLFGVYGYALAFGGP